ncbi:MAG: phosphatase PAP2 family protein [Faecousia sp.]
MNRLYPMYNYRGLRPNNLLKPHYRHLLLLLYWPVFGFLFWYLERVHPVEAYHTMHCFLDDCIPFNEWFAIPYVFWFAFLVIIHVYTGLYDVPCFRKLMKSIIFSYSLSLLIFFLFPTCQELRPTQFERDNFLTRFMARFYILDTSTNVCPSLHVIGSMMVVFAAWNTKRFQTVPWIIAFTAVGILISISTVFLKQHSVLDILVAIPICILTYFLCYGHGKQPKEAAA